MKICPECELNWMEDQEDICPICMQKRRIRKNSIKGNQQIGGEIGEKFYDFLFSCGYKEFTDNGQPSTIHSYLMAIEKVCRWEKLTWIALAKDISIMVKHYDFGGKRESFGNQSHRTVYNALVVYSWFVKKYKIA